MKKVIVSSLTIILVMITSYTPSYALFEPAQNAEHTFYQNEDSTFVLSSSNIQTGDSDYFPETADIKKEQDFNIKGTQEATTFAETSTIGDPMVYLTQKWLNQEYGDVEGFGSVTVNGKTGWNVVYGLTRALQHELGITELANNFGPTTSALYAQNPLRRQDGVTDRKYAILQGALWCKGYNPGYYLTEDPETGVVSFKEVFNASVEAAVISLKEDAGFINPDGVVTPNLMKALLSMDSFKLLNEYYGGQKEIRLMQQNALKKF